MNVKGFFLIFSLLITLLSYSGTDPNKFDHSYALFDQVLKENVSVIDDQSYVDYNNIRKNPVILEKVLEKFSHVKSDQFNRWSKDEKITFLVNAYNAFTIKLIVDKSPKKSILDLSSWYNPYNVFDIDFINLFNKKISLATIEHEFLRKMFNEPRIHFALNCASISCANLRNGAYQAGQLDKQLQQSMLQFLNDKKKNFYDMKDKKLKLSKIFKWFDKDFIKHSGSIENYIAPYIISDKETQNKIKSKKIKIKYLEYNWNLNIKSKK